MADVYKFPSGGYDVTVVKKQDIIDSIENKELNKEITLAFVEQLEIDAANFLKKGRWTGIPFIGNIRIPKLKQLEDTPEQQALIAEAKNNLDSNTYALFRAQLGKENSKHIKQERYYKYITSIAISHNRKLYKKLCETKGEYFARVYLYASYNITSLDNEYSEIINNE